MESSPTAAKSQQALKPNVHGNGTHAAAELVQQAATEADAALTACGSRQARLSAGEVETRTREYGPNQIAREHNVSLGGRLLDNVKNPLVILLTALGVISFVTGDVPGTIVIFLMVLLGIVLRFFQELRADNAAEKLQAMVSTTATVVRDGQA